MTQLLLRAPPHAPITRAFTKPIMACRPVAHWVRGEDGLLRCVWITGRAHRPHLDRGTISRGPGADR